MTIKKSKSKPGAEFQYGSHFSATGSNNISAVDLDIVFIFGAKIVVDVLKREISPNRKLEVDLRRYGRHHGKSICRHNTVADRSNGGKIW